MSSTIQVRVDDELKTQSDNLFRDLGTDTTTAIRMFLKQAVAANGFPFEIKRIKNEESTAYLPLSEEELFAKLTESRAHAEAGQIKDADTVISNMRKKYGL